MQGMGTSHRKAIKHFDQPGQVHELTFSCCQRRPLLTDDRWREMLAERIDPAIERHRLPGLKQHPGLPTLSPIPVDLLS